MTQFGVDLSSYQGPITETEIEALKYVGVTFAYVKATQGKDYINPDAPQQIKALRAAGIKVGLYHFLDPTTDVSSQVQYFLVAASNLGGSDLPVGLDSETPGSSWEALAWQMVAFAMQVENEPHVVRNNQTVFYVNGNFYQNLPGFPWGRGIWFADPGVPAPTKPCLIWQKAPLRFSGFSSIDPDQFMGNDTQWALFTGQQAAAPVAPKVPAPKPTTPAITPEGWKWIEAVAAEEAKKKQELDSITPEGWKYIEGVVAAEKNQHGS